MARRGFTLIELMVVIAIIVILAAILIPSIGLVMKNQKTYRTKVTFDSLKIAIEAYLGPSSLLGVAEDNGDIRRPMDWLHHNLAKADRTMDPTGKACLLDSSGNLSGPFKKCRIIEATHLADAWQNPIYLQVTESAVAGLAHRQETTTVMLRSTAGQPVDRFLDKHIVEVLDVAAGRWQFRELDQIADDGRWLLKPED